MGLLQHGRERTNRFPCLLTPQRGRACSLYGVIVQVCPGVRPERCLRCFANPSGGSVEWRGICTSLAAKTCFYFRLFKSTSWVFWVTFVSFGFRICPNCSCTQLSLIPHSFFIFYCSRRSMSRCKPALQKVPDPSLSHSPMRDYTLLFLKGKGLKVSSETSSFCTGASEPSLP